MRAIIAGAGIGGLTAALCLHGRGIDVDVFEQADAVRELGVGFNILPPAVAVLAELGLLEDLDRRRHPHRHARDDEPARAGDHDRPTRPRRGRSFPQFSIHRGRLQRILVDALTPAPATSSTSTIASSASSTTNTTCGSTS